MYSQRRRAAYGTLHATATSSSKGSFPCFTCCKRERRGWRCNPFEGRDSNEESRVGLDHPARPTLLRTEQTRMGRCRGPLAPGKGLAKERHLLAARVVASAPPARPVVFSTTHGIPDKVPLFAVATSALGVAWTFLTPLTNAAVLLRVQDRIAARTPASLIHRSRANRLCP